MVSDVTGARQARNAGPAPGLPQPPVPAELVQPQAELVQPQAELVQPQAQPAGPAAGPPPDPVPLSPAVRRVIRATAGRLPGQDEAFARQLRHHALALIPDLAGQLVGDGWPLCERLIQVVRWVAETDAPPQAIASALRQAGAQDWREGFPITQYVNLAHALVRAVRDLIEADWTTSMGSAWIAYFLWIQPHLAAGAQEAAERDAAEQEARAQARSAGDAGDADLATAASLLDDEDDEDDEDAGGFGQLMVMMTQSARRERPQRPG